jgi:hypothetical protein
MKKLAVYILAIMYHACFAGESPYVVSACDNTYSITGLKSGNARVTNHGHSSIIKLGHSVIGGTVDEKHSQFVVYGVPKITDNMYPQTTIISIYKYTNSLRRVRKEVVGGGVFDASFSVDGTLAIVEYKYGTLIVDIAKNKSYLTDLDPPVVIKCK